MEIHPGFRKLLELLNANRVEYLIIGGYAVAFYGAPRFTGDIGFYLPRDCLLANKRACGRKKDLADLEALGEE